jgi:hypothetical protein
MSEESELAEQTEVLFNRLRPLFAGHPPEVTGAVLADLLAIWLTSHSYPNSRAATRRMCEQLLTMHVTTVRELLVVNEEIARDRGVLPR